VHFNPWHKNGVKRLPRPVQEYMTRRFSLIPEYLDLLRCFEYEGLVSGKWVRCIRIFSPNKVREHRLSIMTSQDLEQHPEMLLFEGHIDSQGSVYVADRRAPFTRVRVA
jgi:hypothetical protein